MFTDEERLTLKIFCQRLTNTPRPFDKQSSSRIEGFAFCDDWEIIEIVKYLFNGELYWGDPPPNRLKNNPLWKGKQDIVDKANLIVAEYKTVENIIAHLNKRRGF